MPSKELILLIFTVFTRLPSATFSEKRDTPSCSTASQVIGRPLCSGWMVMRFSRRGQSSVSTALDGRYSRGTSIAATFSRVSVWDLPISVFGTITETITCLAGW